MSDQPLPSSFDGDVEFYEEGWVKKLGRRLREEPLVPLGCLATCYALYRATKSMRDGDHYQTNRMFRARIYGQGFTLVAVLAGALYYKDDRMKQKEYNKAMALKKATEKRDAWIRELEMRDKEDSDWRERHEAIEKAAREAKEAAKSMLEDVEYRKEGVILAAVRDLWNRR